MQMDPDAVDVQLSTIRRKGTSLIQFITHKGRLKNHIWTDSYKIFFIISDVFVATGLFVINPTSQMYNFNKLEKMSFQ